VDKIRFTDHRYHWDNLVFGVGRFLDQKEPFNPQAKHYIPGIRVVDPELTGCSVELAVQTSCCS
jgi:hypothetical protein